jgi:hypothetical protein
MKYLLLILTALFSFSFAGLVNINPDPDGEPWWIGGISEPSEELMQRINSLPVLKLADIYKHRKDPLPASIDNSSLQFFRPVFSQSGGSCGQASGIGYNFTYEMNLVRNTSASDSSNQYPTHHTYNFLNDGDGGIGSWYFDGWDIIQSNGCPDLKTYGGIYPDDLTYRHQLWTNGYDKYEKGMNNRVQEQFTIPVDTPEGLETLKQYLIDHADGSSYGGIVNFAAGIGGTYKIGRIAAGLPHANEYIIRQWHYEMNHAMTIVGYDDSVRVDCNADGKYTNDKDINGDSVVDMKDWEIGALLMVNSYGTDWPNTGMGGKCWVSYRTLAMDISVGGIWGNAVHSMRVRESFKPSLKLKAKIEHNNRSALKIYAGISQDTTNSEPANLTLFPLFLYQGGEYGMRGDNDTLEIGLDITPLLSYTLPGQPAKLFLCIGENDPGSIYDGSVLSFSIFEADSTETACTSMPITINNHATTYIPLILSPQFDAPLITTASLPSAVRGELYSTVLAAQNGTQPYTWSLAIDYTELINDSLFPYLNDSLIVTSDPDDGIAEVDLGFDFPFYGKIYNGITVSTDGSILFGDEFESVRSEGAIMKTRTITPFGADLMSYDIYGEGIFIYKNPEFAVIRWYTSLYDMPEVDLEFAVILHPDGKIELFYADGLTTGLSWAAGISGGDPNSTVISALSGNEDPSGMKTAFAPDPFPYGIELSSDGILTGTLSGDPGTWYLNFIAKDNNNISSFKTLEFRLIEPLLTPSGLTLSVSDESVRLDWIEVAEAESYGIYRCDQPFGSFSKIATSPDLYYIDSPISGYDKLFYHITAEKYKK